jgi:hypothetical protein
MKTYFSQCSTKDLELFGDSGTFKVGDNYFYNFVEFGSNPGGVDEFAIADGCGRYVPVSVEDIDNLITILMDIKSLKDEQAYQEKHAAYINDPKATQAVVNDTITITPESLQKHFK